MDPVRFLTSRDPLLVQTMTRVAKRRLELGELEREDQAVRIANAVAKVMFG